LTRPEQEAQLLRIIINKLGDPERKLASNAGYLITKLLSHHEGMKHVVVREVENFIYRPGLSDRARYYAVVYLNQIVLSKKDRPMKLADGTFSSLAKRLVNVYFTLFKLIIDGALGTAAAIAKAATEKKEEKRNLRARKRGKKRSRRGSNENGNEIIGERDGELDSRMLSALITGIRRAFPFVTTDEIEPLINEHAGMFFVVHDAIT
jgi:ribosome biogenesis protein MAK21